VGYEEVVEKKMELVRVNIDGRECEVPVGTNVIQAAAKLGIEIPHFCYHTKLSVSGNCRMCLVEMGMPIKNKETGEIIKDEKGPTRISWGSKPVIACGTEVVDGMHIRTRTEKIKECQRGVIEFLLLNHPLDCPICDKAGECRLQEYAFEFGRGYSRSHEEKNCKPKQTQIGERIILDDERCILCSRCIRFCREVIKEDYLGFTDRGSYTTLTCLPGKPFNSNYSLNTVDICPVGALTSTDFRFKMRVWFLKKTPSICTESSTGVNTFVWSREGKIYRITPRRNDAVNGHWMTDSGRLLYKEQEGERLSRYYLDGAHTDYEETIVRIASLLEEGKVACICSGRMTLEEQYLLSLIMRKVNGKVWLIGHDEEGDGFLIDKDRTPNVQGALLTGLTTTNPITSLNELKESIEKNLIKTLIVCNEDLAQIGLNPELQKKVKLIHIGTRRHPASSTIRAEIPSLTVFEKDGTFINRQRRLQKFHQAVPFRPGVFPDYCFWDSILNFLQSQETSFRPLNDIWTSMSQHLAPLNNIHFSKIPLDGIQLEGTVL